MKVRDVYPHESETHALQNSTTFSELKRVLSETEAHSFPVYEGERLSGILSVDNVRSILFEQGVEEVLIVKDIAMPLVTTTPDESLYQALISFLQSGYGRIPVVEEDNPNRVLGFLRQEDVMTAYNRQIMERKTLAESGTPSRIHDRTSPGDGLQTRDHVHLTRGLISERLVTPRFLVGRTLREANLRAYYRLTVVAVRRKGKRDEEMPNPETPLAGDDVLVIVGTPRDIARFRAGDQDPNPGGTPAA